MQFRDIRTEQAFLEDWDKAPQHVKRRLDRRVKQWSLTGRLSPSAQAHKADRYDCWIIYINLGGGGYRLLARFVDGCMILLRLVDHEEMMEILRPVS